MLNVGVFAIYKQPSWHDSCSPPPPPPLGGGGGYPIIPCPQVGGQAFLYDFFYFFSKKNVDQERFFR